MKDFLILTDSTADLPKDYAKEHNVKIASIPYSIDGQSYGKNKELNAEKFYELMKQGI
ncbi:MAG: DegV family protein, partial [Lachnospiraceae bacterium]